ncbi:branched-chain amino acid transport system II carrier protein [Enterobacter pasteurii]|uniref:branched-chain amino acid transport system II carrier protein n=1 Tax=Enterobacter pasteurii TaxID=3029761 RepID=UPI00159D696A|nr:branched-chain amino acid transport system II carrier protein [Enterobacter pasteurii]QLA68129.1 branched-chain amino acid transport system II carrier protein [Enterobacter pasteurii]
MRKQILPNSDVIALGFMTLALFLGAGNIIYPPIVGKMTGEYYLISSIGFNISGVLLPMLAIIVLAEKKGDPLAVCAPMGKFWGAVLASSFYLFLGVFFASPRTATVSYEMGLVNFLDDTPLHLGLYSGIFFAVVWVLGLYPGRLLKTIGYVLAPLKLLCLLCLAIYATRSHVAPLVDISSGESLKTFSDGFMNGYLTMDTLSALTFGMIVINSMKGKGVTEREDIKHYAKTSVVFAGIGLVAIYLCLMKIGAGFGQTGDFQNGAQILRAFIVENMGMGGTIFMAALIYLACTVTAVGLTSATATLFSQMSGISYKILLPLIVGASFLIANIGLTRLIGISVPALSVICPACTTLILLSILRWPAHAIALPVWVSIAFSTYTAVLKPLGFFVTPMDKLPLTSVSLGWVLPTALMALVLLLKDKASNKVVVASN